MLKVGHAIEVAHAGGIIHRDLKPSNVLLDTIGEPKKVGFGLVRLTRADSTTALTVTGDKFLSLGYAAPEQEKDATLTDERAQRFIQEFRDLSPAQDAFEDELHQLPAKIQKRDLLRQLSRRQRRVVSVRGVVGLIVIVSVYLLVMPVFIRFNVPVYACCIDRHVCCCVCRRLVLLHSGMLLYGALKI